MEGWKDMAEAAMYKLGSIMGGGVRYMLYGLTMAE
jgi:hypothetical protein